MPEPTPPPPHRKTQMNLVVSINGTGKTTFLREKVVSHAAKALIVTPDEMEWRELPVISTAAEVYNLHDRARIVYQGPETLEMVVRYFYGSTFILDDAMTYLQFQTPDTLRALYIRRRQRGMDVYIVAHGLRQVPCSASPSAATSSSSPPPRTSSTPTSTSNSTIIYNIYSSITSITNTKNLNLNTNFFNIFIIQKNTIILI